MAFTDEDLKILKEKWSAERYEVRPDEIENLIARLEAAERYIAVTWGALPMDIGMAEAWNAWREAAGNEDLL